MLHDGIWHHRLDPAATLVGVDPGIDDMIDHDIKLITPGLRKVQQRFVPAVQRHELAKDKTDAFLRIYRHIRVIVSMENLPVMIYAWAQIIHPWLAHLTCLAPQSLSICPKAS